MTGIDAAQTAADYLALKSGEWARFCGAGTGWETRLCSEVLA